MTTEADDAGNEEEGRDGETRDPQSSGTSPIPAVPAPPLPSGTKAPVHVNQQVNYYQLPETAFDRLSNDQVMELAKFAMQKADETDKRHFHFAMTQARREAKGRTLAILVGGAVAVVGIGVSALLSMYGHELVAVCVAVPLTTILAIVVGNRFLG